MICVAHRCLDSGCSPETTVELMFDHWNFEKCTPPYDFDRLHSHVVSLAGSRQTPIGSMTIEAVFGDLPPDQLAKAMAPPAPELAESIQAAHAARVASQAAEAAEAEAVAAETPAEAVSGAAWRKRFLPPKELGRRVPWNAEWNAALKKTPKTPSAFPKVECNEINGLGLCAPFDKLNMFLKKAPNEDSPNDPNRPHRQTEITPTRQSGAA
jgi:hypothetical protein